MSKAALTLLAQIVPYIEWISNEYGLNNDPWLRNAKEALKDNDVEQASPLE